MVNRLSVPTLIIVTLALLIRDARAECPGAGRLQEALILVGDANPVLTTERDIYREQQRQRSWDASITIGYSITDTFESGAAGPNAALRVRIPLWDRSTELKTSERKQAKPPVRVTAEACRAIKAECQVAAPTGRNPSCTTPQKWARMRVRIEGCGELVPVERLLLTDVRIEREISLTT